jgi:hypothetical protein
VDRRGAPPRLDQLEELFAYPGPERRKALDELAEALRRCDPAVHFLLSVREDALATLDRFEGRVPGLLDRLLRIEHLGRDAAREATLKPCDRWNTTVAKPGEEVQFEPALVEAVLEEVEAGKVSLGEGGAAALDGGRGKGIETPYLQLVLTRLWDEERAAGSHVLRLQTLERLGGADRIVRTHLDTVLAALPRSEQDVAGRTFRYLVTSSGTKIAQSVADLADYAHLPPERVEPLVDRLAGEVRIVRPAGDGRYEIYHDALAGPILDWRTRWDERQKRRRDRRRLGILGGAVVVLAAISVAIAVLAVQARRAQREARVGESRALAAQALGTLERDPLAGLHLAVEAAYALFTADAEAALRASLAEPQPHAILKAHDGPVLGAAFSPDGSLIVTAGADGTARLWQTDTGTPVRVVRGHDDFVNTAAFSSDGDLIVTASDDGTTLIWRCDVCEQRDELLARAEAILAGPGVAQEAASAVR